MDHVQRENQEMTKTYKQLQETNRKLEAKVNSGLTRYNSKYDNIVNKLKERNQFLENEVVRLSDISQSQAREINVLNDALDTNLKDANIEEKLIYEASSLKEDNKILQSNNEQLMNTINVLENNLRTVSEKYHLSEDQLKQYELALSEISGKVII
jgi:chaperonin cofactor prefoldin